MNTDKLWHKYNTFRLRKSKQFTPVIYKALQTQIEFFAATKKVDEIPMQPVYDTVKSVYMNAGRLWAHQTYINVMQDAGLKKKPQTKGLMPIGFNEYFISSIQQYFQLRLLEDAVIPITQTTQDWIRKQLNDGIEQGLGIDAIVRGMLESDITQ